MPTLQELIAQALAAQPSPPKRPALGRSIYGAPEVAAPPDAREAVRQAVLRTGRAGVSALSALGEALDQRPRGVPRELSTSPGRLLNLPGSVLASGASGFVDALTGTRTPVNIDPLGDVPQTSFADVGQRVGGLPGTLAGMAADIAAPGPGEMSALGKFGGFTPMMGMVRMEPDMIRAFGATAPGRLAERAVRELQRVSRLKSDPKLVQKLGDITEAVAAERPERWGQLEELTISPQTEGSTFGRYFTGRQQREIDLPTHRIVQEERLAKGLPAPTTNRIDIAPVIEQSQTMRLPDGSFMRLPLDMPTRYEHTLRHEGSHLGMDARDLLQSGPAGYQNFRAYALNPHEVLAELEGRGLEVTDETVREQLLSWYRHNKRWPGLVTPRDLENFASGIRELTTPGAGSRIPYEEPSASLSPAAFILDPRQLHRLTFPEFLRRRTTR